VCKCSRLDEGPPALRGINPIVSIWWAWRKVEFSTLDAWGKTWWLVTLLSSLVAAYKLAPEAHHILTMAVTRLAVGLGTAAGTGATAATAATGTTATVAAATPTSWPDSAVKITSLLLTACGWGRRYRANRSVHKEVTETSLPRTGIFTDLLQKLDRAAKARNTSSGVREYDRNEAGWSDQEVNQQLLALSSAGTSLIPLKVQGTWLAYRRDDDAGVSRRDRIRRYVMQRGARAKKTIANDAKVRLLTDLTAPLPGAIEIQKTDYFSTLMTDACAFKVLRWGTDTVLSDGYSDFIAPMPAGEFRLLPLSRTRTSNQLGVSTLAFTSDGSLILVRQSKANEYSAGLLAPSGSGSLDWSDTDEAQDFINLIARGAGRELFEELGLARDGRLDFETFVRHHIVVYAFSRMIHRAGKPEFYCLSFLPFTVSDIQRMKLSRKERAFTEGSQAFSSDAIDHRASSISAELKRVAGYLSEPHPGHLLGEGLFERSSLSFPVIDALTLLRVTLEDTESSAIIEKFYARCTSRSSARN
jgi:hypothetical protein